MQTLFWACAFHNISTVESNKNVKMAMTMELDPLFVKALRLLHSRSKDATEQLKQMVDEALDRKRGDEFDKKAHDDGFDSSSSKTSSRKEKEANESKKRESEKRHIEKLQQDLAELSQEVPAKKAKLDSSESQGEGGIKKEKDTDRLWEKEKSKEKSGKDREEKPREKDWVREHERERDQEWEKQQWELAKKADTSSNSDTESEKEDESKEPQDEDMDVDDFALFQGIACVVCKQFDVSSGNQLVECQECHSLYHQECHKPPVIENNVNDPRFVWYCSKCIKNLKKTAAAKAPKTKTSAPVVARETVNSRSTRVEPPIQPFRRLEPSKPSVAKEGSGSSGRPLMGLASLAANLSGKEKHSKPAGHKSPGSSSHGRSSDSGSRKNSGSTSLIKPELLKSSSKESGKTASSGLGLGALARPDVVKPSAKRDVKPGQSLLGKPTPISSSNAFAESSFGAALTSGLPKLPSASSVGKTAGSAVSTSATTSSSSSGKPSQSSMISADKRLQMMKKKAAAKLHEKRALPK